MPLPLVWSSLDPDADPVEQLFLREPVQYEWVQTRSPAGAIQFEAVDDRKLSRIRLIRRRNVNRQCWDRPDAAF